MEASERDLIGVWHFREGQHPQLLSFNSSEAPHAAHALPRDDPGLESYFIPDPLATLFSNAFSPVIQGPSIQAASSSSSQNSASLGSKTSQQGLQQHNHGCYFMKTNNPPQFLSFSDVIPAESDCRPQPATEESMAALKEFFLSPEESMAAVSIMNAVRQESKSAATVKANDT